MHTYVAIHTKWVQMHVSYMDINILTIMYTLLQNNLFINNFIYFLLLITLWYDAWCFHIFKCICICFCFIFMSFCSFIWTYTSACIITGGWLLIYFLLSYCSFIHLFKTYQFFYFICFLYARCSTLLIIVNLILDIQIHTHACLQ